jgi:polar amino acid transport system substrate-binding protein
MKFTCVAVLALLASISCAEARPFIVVGGNDVAPYQSIGPDGKAAGVLIDLYDECFRRLGVELEYDIFPWARAQLRVETGEADAMTTVVTEDRLRYAVPGHEILGAQHIVAFASTANPHFDEIMKAHGIEELQRLHVLAPAGSGWFAEHFPENSIEYGGNPRDLLEMLLLGRGDFIVEDARTMARRLATLRQDDPELSLDTVVASANVLTTLEFHILVSKKSGYLDRLGEIDRTLAQMREDGTLHRIYAKFGLDGPS